MELNEIKKILYKQNPKAVLHFIKGGVAYSSTSISDEENITFNVPVNDMGDAPFYKEMEAKHLIRWISE